MGARSRARQLGRAATIIGAAAFTSSASAGMLEPGGGSSSIQFASASTPLVFTGGLSDFSLIMWVRRSGWSEGQYTGVLDANAVLQIGFDDAADVIRFDLRGAPANVGVAIPLRDASPDMKVPVGEWMLLACAWDASAVRLAAWARSETTSMLSSADEQPGWTGATPWPITIGAAGASDAFSGHLGLVVVRDHLIDAGDLDAIWNAGAPHYFSPALLQSGNLNGFDGVAWMIAHGVLTSPWTNINGSAAGGELGGAVSVDNVLVYNTRDGSSFFSAGRIDALVGPWTFRSPHEDGAEWAGFFVRQLPDLGIPEPHYVAHASPRARELADDAPDGLVRVVISANSRTARLNHAFYDGGMENWPHGGLFRARRSSIAGVIVPALLTNGGPWPGFENDARTIGAVWPSAQTPLNSVAFGNFGSHGADSGLFPDYPLTGGVIVIEDGGSYVPKARPEPGTLFSEKTDPLTVRAMLLRFPGAGDVVYQGEKAATQNTTTVTTAGPPLTLPLDTTVVTHELVPGDAIDAGARSITLSGAVGPIEVGDGCFISAGEGQGGISLVSAVESIGGPATRVTLEKWFPTAPEAGSSTLRFGPVDPVWVAHEWDGLDAADPEVFRGVRLTADGGIVVVMFMECFDPGAHGFVVGGVGRSGRGYAVQLSELFRTGGIPFMKGLAADVWLQFFAHQQSAPSSMIDYTDEVRAASPDTEIWWCGDPDLEPTGVDESAMDDWQAFILDNAEANDIGAIVAHEHPAIGIADERALDGQSANRGHLTARGNELYMNAVLEMMREAALDGPGDACPADLDASGAVGIQDLLLVLANWGPCVACVADLDDDGQVGFADLLSLLAAWGPCVRA